jgi:calcineurin-like phosphoesterase family protein
MSNNIFFISDTHFGHEKTCTTFKRWDGSPLRPFANAQEMDEEMVRRWNDVVKDGDKVYHLGDVVISNKHITTLGRLNGTKRLVRGNHDIFKTKVYLEYFKEIYGVRVLEDLVLTHVPLHRESITQRWGINVHGHLHANNVTLPKPYPKMEMGVTYKVTIPAEQIQDPLYCNVSVEQIDYRPIELSELRERIKKARENYGDEPRHAAYVHVR